MCCVLSLLAPFCGSCHSYNLKQLTKFNTICSKTTQFANTQNAKNTQTNSDIRIKYARIFFLCIWKRLIAVTIGKCEFRLSFRYINCFLDLWRSFMIQGYRKIWFCKMYRFFLSLSKSSLVVYFDTRFTVFRRRNYPF